MVAQEAPKRGPCRWKRIREEEKDWIVADNVDADLHETCPCILVVLHKEDLRDNDMQCIIPT